MRTVKLVIAFQGTRFDGWQSQRTGKTLQELFEKLLERILKEKTDLVGSSRTDKGVHAQGFVAHFRTKNRLPDAKIKDALNFYLPEDVLVRSAETVSAGFHARYHARSKTYEYLIWNDRTRPSYDLAPFILWCPSKLDTRKMSQAARFFIGRHDFSAFRDSGDEEKDATRRIASLTVRKKGQKVSITVKADGFLRHMVRVIAGTLIEVGRGKLPIKDIKSLIASKNRKKSGPTAKPHGLTLLEVRY
jgi:tRNA pseudouridine38-40 synthase